MIISYVFICVFRRIDSKVLKYFCTIQYIQLYITIKMLLRACRTQLRDSAPSHTSNCCTSITVVSVTLSTGCCCVCRYSSIYCSKACFLYESYRKCDFARKYRIKFQIKFPEKTITNTRGIHEFVNKFRPAW